MGSKFCIITIFVRKKINSIFERNLRFRSLIRAARVYPNTERGLGFADKLPAPPRIHHLDVSGTFITLYLNSFKSRVVLRGF